MRNKFDKKLVHRKISASGIFPVIFLSSLLVSCVPQATTIPVPAASETPIQYAPLIRFALLDEPKDVNVWALFDEEGAGYGNYAIRWEYWPRLYSLSIPEREIVPMAAQGQPTTIIREGEYYTATVDLRSDLRWTDGKPFTGEDAAFTINSALDFELGFDWKAYYDHEILDHAQAIDPATIKYFFKKAPNVGAWQYGALLGPIVQKEYWEEKTAQAEALLTEDTDEDAILEAESQKVALDTEVSGLNRKLFAVQQSGGQDRQLEAEIKRKQSNLDAANNTLVELTEARQSQFEQARQELYALADDDEPTLGNWSPAGLANNDWINEVNKDYPFGQPQFDRVLFRYFPDEADAVSGLQENEVDAILGPDGLSLDVINSLSGDESIHILRSMTSSSRFLVFNLSTPPLDNIALRQAMSCLLEGTVFVNHALQNLPEMTGNFIPDASWRGTSQANPCDAIETNDPVLTAVEILKTDGYSWDVEPTGEIPGSGLRMPGGSLFPEITLLVTSTDPDRVEAANAIKESIDRLGIPLTITELESDEVFYRIFSSHHFDLAILGWKLGGFPDYLCDWFGESNIFQFESDKINTDCATLDQETDLNAAKRTIEEMLAVLAQEQPFIPLFSVVRSDAFRNIKYPYEDELDGFGFSYGAPSLALPSP